IALKKCLQKESIDENSESCTNIANNDLIDIFNSDIDSNDILFPTKTLEAIDIFNMIFDMFWKNIVTETNQYAEQTINNKNKRRKIDETWFPVDCNEIKMYFALRIITAQKCIQWKRIFVTSRLDGRRKIANAIVQPKCVNTMQSFAQPARTFDSGIRGEVCRLERLQDRI
ncbi:unnamed protein product, partial [Heterotrigona itama]